MELNKNVRLCINNHYKTESNKHITDIEHKILAKSNSRRNIYTKKGKIKASNENDAKCIVAIVEEIGLEQLKTRKK